MDEWWPSTVCALLLSDPDNVLPQWGHGGPCTLRDFRGGVPGSSEDKAALFAYRYDVGAAPFNESDWHYKMGAQPQLWHPMKF